ncbi:MAG: site-specific integrase [Burkholderiales bacterium]|nr:site-specific integrase [Burkholderiales bacterium]
MTNSLSRRAFTLTELIDAFMAQYAGPDRGIGTRLAFWSQRLGDRVAAEISPDDVADTLAELALGRGRTYLGKDENGERRFKERGHAARAPATVNRYLTSLGSVYRFARRRRLLPRGHVSPTRGIERAPTNNGRVRFLDDGERARLLATCRTSSWSRLSLLVLMAVTTGARRGELLALTWRDLDLEKRHAYVRTSKNGEPRMLVLVAPVLAEIERIRSRRADDFVFASDKRPGRAMRIERAFREACAAARIEDFRFHDLRHTAASYLAQNGASLIEIADTLGHKQLQMVRRYAHLSIASKVALADRVFSNIA